MYEQSRQATRQFSRSNFTLTANIMKNRELSPTKKPPKHTFGEDGSFSQQMLQQAKECRKVIGNSTPTDIISQYKSLDSKYKEYINERMFVLELIETMKENINYSQRNENLDDYSDILLTNLEELYSNLKIEEKEYIKVALHEIINKKTIRQTMREIQQRAINTYHEFETSSEDE